MLKTTVLLAALTGLLVAIGSFWGPAGMTIALILAIIMNFGSYWFSDKIVLAMYHAREVSESESPNLYRIVRGLAYKANLPMPKVYMVDSPMANAFATGRNPEHAAVAVTTGILKLLDEKELSGVIAHELSHVKNRDILLSTIAATMAGAIGMLARMAQFGALFGGARSNGDEGGRGNFIGVLIFSMIAAFAAMLIQMAISRSREYMADEGGAHLSHPLSLAKALGKLDMGAKRIPMDATPATAHMFIVNPLRGGGVLSLFSTHPPIEERIARLEEMARAGKF